MSQSVEFPLELAELFHRLCEGELAPEQAARLEESLRTDPALCRLYLRYIDLYVELRRRYSTGIRRFPLRMFSPTPFTTRSAFSPRAGRWRTWWQR